MPTVTVSTAEEAISMFSTEVTEETTYEIQNDITLSNVFDSTVKMGYKTINGNGHTISNFQSTATQVMGVATSQTLTINDLKFSNFYIPSATYVFYLGKAASDTVTLNNCEFYMSGNVVTILQFSNYSGVVMTYCKITFNNCILPREFCARSRLSYCYIMFGQNVTIRNTTLTTIYFYDCYITGTARMEGTGGMGMVCRNCIINFTPTGETQTQMSSQDGTRCQFIQYR